MAALIFVLTFVVVTLVILGIWVLATAEPGQEVIRRRMEAVRKAERRGDVSLELKLARDEMLSSVPFIHRLMLHWTWSARLQSFIAQSGIQMKAAKLILISLVMGAASYLLIAPVVSSVSGFRAYCLGCSRYTVRLRCLASAEAFRQI